MFNRVNSNILIALLLSLYFLQSKTMVAAKREPIKFKKFAIVYKNEDPKYKLSPKGWNRICKNFEKSVTGERRGGSWAIDLPFVCLMNPRKLKTHSLALIFEQKEESLHVRLMNPSIAKDFSSVHLKRSKRFIKKGLVAPVVAEAIILFLFDHAPFSGVINPKKVSFPSIKNGPKKLAVYSLKKEKNQFLVPQLVGVLAAKKGRSYQWIWRDNFLFNKGTLFFHDLRGPGSNQIRTALRLKAAVRKYGSTIILNNFLLDTLVGGYGGIRFGYPLTSGDQLISKSNMLGIFGDVMGGPLEGVRFNYDLGLESSTTIDGTKYHYSWGRMSLGYAFSMPLIELYGLNFDIEFTPRLNLFDLDASIPASDGNGGSIPSAFKISNDPGLGGEIAIVLKRDTTFYRGWVSSDLSGIVEIVENDSTISTVKAGVDAYMDLFTLFGGFDLMFLAFGSAEKITIEREKASVLSDLESGSSNGGRRLAYINIYLGIGATLQW